MNLQIELPEALGRRLADEAHKRGSALSNLAVELLEQSLPISTNSTKAKSTSEMILGWVAQDEMMSDDDISRHRSVLKAIDEDRSSDRKLFAKVLAEKFQ